MERILIEGLRQTFDIRMEVGSVLRGTLVRSDYKSRMFVDARKVRK